MAVRFVIGRAGSGKTRHCLESIVGAMREEPFGAGIYWLLPKQATFMAERELTCASGLGAFCRTRIVSFDLLGREILTECGGGVVPEITSLGRQMILGHLLRKHAGELKYFATVARHGGLAAKLNATFGEFERCGKTAGDLLGLLREMEGNQVDAQSAGMVAKLHDLHLIYSAYCEYLGQDRLDPQKRLEQVLGRIHQCELLKEATFYVDGFADFMESERRVLAGVAKVCRSMEICLMIDPGSETVRDVHRLPGELSLFHRTEEAYRRLRLTIDEEGVEIGQTVYLKEVHRFKNEWIGRLERGMFTEGKKTKAVEGGVVGIELVEASDKRGEVDAAARCVKGLLREGYRLREIAVLARDLRPFHDWVVASFLEHDIPFFADKRRAMAHHPLMQFVRAVFLTAQGNGPHEAIMSLLKCGLSGLGEDEADELENYVLKHGIRGGVWFSEKAWKYRRTLKREDEEDEGERMEAERAEGMRRKVVERLRGFVEKMKEGKGTLTIRGIIGELFALMERCEVRRKLSEWMAEAVKEERFEQKSEHEQVWSKLMELFDQMVDLLGDEEVELGDFLEILDSGLEGFDLALTPQTVDQVLVGQIDRSRSPEVRAVVLLGMNEGIFPMVPSEDSVLSDSERRMLRERKIDVDPDSQRELLNENLFGYVAITRASERLYLTRSTADDKGRVMGESPFWRRIREVLPGVKVKAGELEDKRPAEAINTPRQLVTGLMRWARKGDICDAEAGAWRGLYQWLAGHECNDDAVDRMRFRAWKAMKYGNEARLSEGVAGAVFKVPLHASVTRIEAFAMCPFKHFVRYGLKLNEREEAEVTHMDLGNVYHQVLEKLVRRMIESRQDWQDMEPEVCEELIGKFAGEIGKELRGELMLSSARNKYLLQRIEKTLREVVAQHRAIRQRSQFRPAYAELGFGSGEDGLPAFRLMTPRGREVLLHGKIDRVDVVQDQAEVAVIDYKLSGKTLSLQQVYHGLSLQLLTYLLVLQANGQRLAKRELTPVAAFYVQLLRKLDSVNTPGEAREPSDPLFDLRVKPRGIFDGNCMGRLDGETGPGGRSNVVQAYIKKDGTFGSGGDMAESEKFAALLSHVKKRLGELADQIIGGNIGILPYRIGRVSPCPNCEYRCVCRFDVLMNRYKVLPVMGKDEVLERVVEGNHE